MKGAPEVRCQNIKSPISNPHSIFFSRWPLRPVLIVDQVGVGETGPYSPFFKLCIGHGGCVLKITCNLALWLYVEGVWHTSA